MKRKEFVSALNKQTESVHVSSRLRQKTLDAAYGKEPIRMKKRIPALALAVVLSIVFCATALAIASRAGMLEYQNLLYNKYVPENADAAIEQDVYATGSDLIDISVRELYYDGLTSRITVDVTAKDERVLLVHSGAGSGYFWKNLNRLNPEADGNDTRTVAEVFQEGRYSSAYGVNMHLYDAENRMLGGAGDCFYTAPGVLTFFLQNSYAEDLPERDVRFSAEITPFLDAEGNRIEADSENVVCLEEELRLTSSASDGAVYINTKPVAFGEIGVTLDEMQLFVKPQELYVKLYYTVSDTELNRRLYSANTKERDQLALEFIDSSILSDSPLAQRLSEGPTGHVIRTMLSGKDEMPLRWVEEFTLGVNELKDSYTLRVYDEYTEERYDSAVVTLREATDAEIEALRENK